LFYIFDQLKVYIVFMKPFRHIISILLLFTIIFSACDETQIACTDEFRTIGLSVYGDNLSDFFTIRLKNNDTLRFENYNFPQDNNYYVVLDDSYHHMMVNQYENFRFIGIINDSIVVNEVFFIKADQCHVEKLNGVESVTL